MTTTSQGILNKYKNLIQIKDHCKPIKQLLISHSCCSVKNHSQFLELLFQQIQNVLGVASTGRRAALTTEIRTEMKIQQIRGIFHFSVMFLVKTDSSTILKSLINPLRKFLFNIVTSSFIIQYSDKPFKSSVSAEGIIRSFWHVQHSWYSHIPTIHKNLLHFSHVYMPPSTQFLHMNYIRDLDICHEYSLPLPCIRCIVRRWNSHCISFIF